MKDKRLKDVEKILKENGCILKREGSRSHSIWENSKGHSFALPNHKIISPGVLRKLEKFLDL